MENKAKDIEQRSSYIPTGCFENEIQKDFSDLDLRVLLVFCLL